nr:MAG TPA: hypothetical protein [Caudoviricetes sp.]
MQWGHVPDWAAEKVTRGYTRGGANYITRLLPEGRGRFFMR